MAARKSNGKLPHHAVRQEQSGLYSWFPVAWTQPRQHQRDLRLSGFRQDRTFVAGSNSGGKAQNNVTAGGLRLLYPPSGQGTGGKDRTRAKSVTVNLRVEDDELINPQQGDLRLSDSPLGRKVSGGARTRDRRVPANLRADSLATVPPTLPPCRRSRQPMDHQHLDKNNGIIIKATFKPKRWYSQRSFRCRLGFDSTTDGLAWRGLEIMGSHCCGWVLVTKQTSLSHTDRGVGGSVDSDPAPRSAGTFLSQVRAPPPASRPDEGPESLRSSYCRLAIYKNQNKPISTRLPGMFRL
ncbi:hypothetical protein PoB_002511500 [Plakobranchus ocellatus]|uniref:Uncharacterized protein n=1 Tax=Plakobranchus ocellatus TaxID=259542 RepID=A0AAV3ZU01_9GAST|nr:hypothetical protein PoB_002511500 [Plakobranchus ocellatus]